MDEAILLAEALLKQLLVGAVDVAEPLAQVTIVAASNKTSMLAALQQRQLGDCVYEKSRWLTPLPRQQCLVKLSPVTDTESAGRGRQSACRDGC